MYSLYIWSVLSKNLQQNAAMQSNMFGAHSKFDYFTCFCIIKTVVNSMNVVVCMQLVKIVLCSVIAAVASVSVIGSSVTEMYRINTVAARQSKVAQQKAATEKLIVVHKKMVKQQNKANRLFGVLKCIMAVMLVPMAFAGLTMIPSAWLLTVAFPFAGMIFMAAAASVIITPFWLLGSAMRDDFYPREEERCNCCSDIEIEVVEA